MKKILILMCMLLLISFASAETSLQTLGTFKQGESVNLVQNCLTSTYSNISRIVYPNGTLAINSQTAMTKNGDDYSYSFTDTNLSGQYLVYGTCDESGTKTNWVYDFYITLNGKEPADAILVVVFIIIFMIIFGLMIFSLLNALTHVLALDMDIKDTAFMMVSYFLMWIFYYFSFEYLGNNFINEILELAIDIGGITHVILPIIGFMVSFIMTNLKFKQKQRITY